MKNKNQRTISLPKRRTIILLIVTIIILSFIVLKLQIVKSFNQANLNLAKQINSYKNKVTYQVITEEVENNYLEFEAIRFLNIIDDSYQTEEHNNAFQKSISYKNTETKEGITIATIKPYLALYKQDITYYTDTNKKEKSFNLTNPTIKEKNKYLKENNLKTDLDLYKHLEKIATKKANFFTSITEMKNIKSLKLFGKTALPEAEKMIVLKGNITGYILITEKLTEITLEHATENYKIILFGNLSNKETAEQILKTIKFIKK